MYCTSLPPVYAVLLDHAATPAQLPELDADVVVEPPAELVEVAELMVVVSLEAEPEHALTAGIGSVFCRMQRLETY